MRLKSADALSLGIIAAVGVLALVQYAAIPDPMPSRFNPVTGEITGYMSKPWGVLIVVATPIVTYVLLKILPAVSPRGFRMDAFQRVIEVFMVTLTVCVGGVGAAVLLAASGVDVAMGTVVYLLVGGTFAVFGNLLGKVRKNFFIGIRTPWTLTSDEVWARTHRLGGRLFVVSGIVLMAAALTGLQPPVPLIVVVIVGAALTPVVYSLLLYRKLEGFRRSEEGAER